MFFIWCLLHTLTKFALENCLFPCVFFILQFLALWVNFPFCLLFTALFDGVEELAFFALRSRLWTFSMLTIRSARAFYAELLSSWLTPTLCWCSGLFLPRCVTWHFYLSFSFACFSSPSTSTWMADAHGDQHVLNHLGTWLKDTLCLIVHVIRADLNSLGLNIDFWGTPPMASIQLDFLLLITNLCLALELVFSSVHYAFI